GRRLVVGAEGVTPPEGALGVRVMSMDLLLPSDDAPLIWEAPTQAESHTWRGAMEANALREFLADTAWGALDVLLLDLPPGTDRLVTVASLLPVLSGTIVVTIPSDVSHLVVRKSITIAAQTKAPVLGLVENMSGLFPGPSGAAAACCSRAARGRRIRVPGTRPAASSKPARHPSRGCAASFARRSASGYDARASSASPPTATDPAASRCWPPRIA